MRNPFWRIAGATLATGALSVWLLGCGGGLQQSPVEDEKKVLEESISGAAPPGVDAGQVDMEALYQGGADVNAEVFEKAQRELYKGYPGMDRGPEQQ